jgi:predicted heme/steroid binding protein
MRHKAHKRQANSLKAKARALQSRTSGKVTLFALTGRSYYLHRQKLTDDELLALLHSAGQDLAEQMNKKRGPSLIVPPTIEQTAQVMRG